MASAKDIVLAPIASKDAHAFVRRHHYSGKTVNNSQLHFGVFLNDRIIGALQFGPSLDKSKIRPLVTDTPWNGFLELNRMVMIDDTPVNTESRSIAVAMRLIRKHYPHIQWVVSFADATQCGDGTIYRASGFVLTGVHANNTLYKMPNGEVITQMIATNQARPARHRLMDTLGIVETGKVSMLPFIKAGVQLLEGFQMRYMYFLDPTARARLTVPEIPFSRIVEMGASMYKGKRQKDSSEPLGDLPREGGAAPTLTLQNPFELVDKFARYYNG